MQTYFNWYRDQQGNAIQGGQVNVYYAGTDTLAVIYEPVSTGTPSFTKANPFTTDANGYFQFAAPNGDYDIQLSGNSVSTAVIPGVNIWDGGTGPGGPMTNPMSNLGEFVYGGAAGTPTAGAANTSTTPKYLREVGTGTAGAPPSWEVPAASEISNTPSGNVVSTNVQAAINELDADLTTADGLALHKAGAENVTGVKTFTAQPSGIAASSIVNTPSGTIAAVNVQSAINEIVSDLADTSSASNGDALVGSKRTAITGAIATTVHKEIEALSVNIAANFGAVGDDSTNNDTAFGLAVTYASGATTPVEIVFPAGTYRFSTAPNWAIPNLTLRALGRVVLKHTGTGVCWKFDSPVSNLYNMRMLGDFYITGNASSTDGLYVRGCHHSEFQASIWNVASAGVRVNFSIESRFQVRVTAAGLTSTVVPVNGAVLDKRSAGERCGGIWYECVFENVSGDGVLMTSCDGPVFLGGTSENNGGCGFKQTSDCYNATFVGTWCEGNGGISDWELIGKNNTLSGCRATSTTISGAGNNNVRCYGQGAYLSGGTLRNITVDSSSAATTITGVGMANGAGGITGTGAYKCVGAYFYDASFNFVSNQTDLVGESSSFVPTLIGSTTAGAQTYTNQYGFCTKIGKTVTGTAYVSISAKGGTIAGNIQIGGFPFTSRNVANHFATLNVQSWNGITLDAGRTFLSANINPGNSVATLYQSGSAVTATPVPVANLAAASSIVVTFCYLTD